MEAPKFSIDEIEQGILCCISPRFCRECPYIIFNNGKWEASCEFFLKKDISDIFIQFKEILIGNKNS